MGGTTAATIAAWNWRNLPVGVGLPVGAGCHHWAGRWNCWDCTASPVGTVGEAGI